MTLLETLERVRSSTSLGDSESIKFNVIAPLLEKLGWAIYGDEVRFDYSLRRRRREKVDVALGKEEALVAIIGVLDQDADPEELVEKFLSNAVDLGVDICFLTNGLMWWLFLPKESGNSSERIFRVLNLRQHSIGQLENDFTAFLGRENYSHDQAINQARELLASKRQDSTLDSTISRILVEMLQNPDETLINSLAQRVQQNLNKTPTREQVLAAFRRQSGARVPQQPEGNPRSAPPPF